LAPDDCGESGIVPLACSEEIDLMSESFSAFREQYLRRHEEPSSPSAGLTFVNPPGVQEVVLAHPDNPVVFELNPFQSFRR